MTRSCDGEEKGHLVLVRACVDGVLLASEISQGTRVDAYETNIFAHATGLWAGACDQSIHPPAGRPGAAHIPFASTDRDDDDIRPPWHLNSAGRAGCVFSHEGPAGVGAWVWDYSGVRSAVGEALGPAIRCGSGYLLRHTLLEPHLTSIGHTQRSILELLEALVEANLMHDLVEIAGHQPVGVVTRRVFRYLSSPNRWVEQTDTPPCGRGIPGPAP